MAEKPWREQWHIAPDGRVIRQRSRGDEAHQQLFQEFTATRPMTIADLDELDRRVAASHRRTAVVARPVLAVAWLGLAAAGLGVVLGLLGVPPGFLVAGVGIAVVAVSMVVNGLVMGAGISRYQRIFREAGFGSHNGVTVSAREAAELVRSPGAQSGSVTRTKR